MGFEQTISAFEGTKTDLALDLAVIVIDSTWHDSQIKQKLLSWEACTYFLLQYVSCEIETEF
jgi:hypothetical protein